MATDNVNTGPIGIDDVRNALGEGDPFATNAGALQKLIGRGSNATVQKHLEALRAAARPAVEIAPGTAPAAPADAVAAMWSAAWSAAQVHTLGRLEAVTAQREQLLDTVAQQSQDLAASIAEADTLKALSISFAETTEAAKAEAEKTKDDAEKSAAASSMALERARIDFERLKSESESSVALVQKDAQNAALTLQATIDRLTDQVGELKSLLHRQPQP